MSWISGDCERRVYNAAVYMHAKVDRHHIAVPQHRVRSTRIWRPMSSDMVDAQTRRKSQSSNKRITDFETLMPAERTHAGFDLLRDNGQFHAGLDDVLLDMMADLSMDLSPLPVLGKETVIPLARFVALLL